jgi:hypothetical protein
MVFAAKFNRGITLPFRKRQRAEYAVGIRVTEGLGYFRSHCLHWLQWSMYGKH